MRSAPPADTPRARRPARCAEQVAGSRSSGPRPVAQRTGRSIAVVLEVHASFLDGGEQAARRQVETALGTRR